MKKKVILILSICFIFISSTFAANTEITIIYAGSANGILESCLCPGNLYGGYVNRLAVLDSLREIYPEAIVIDLGDFLPAMPDSLKSAYILKAVAACRMDVIGVGDQDFIQGVNFIVSSNLPLISMFCGKPGTLDAFFPAYKTFDREGIKILFTSLLDPQLFDFYPDSIRKAIELPPPDEAWRKFTVLSELKPDLTILISHMGYDRDLEFLKTHTDIDVLFSGHSQVLLPQPEVHGKTIVAAPGKNGEDVGVLHLNVPGSGEVVNFTHDLIPLKAEIVGESPVIRQLINEYDTDLREELKRKAIAGGRIFHGTAFCAECHRAEFESWQKTIHASAFDTLRNLGKSEMSNCIDCHTTGYGYPGGFESGESTPDMAGVGCEECHRVPKSADFSSGKHNVLPVIEKWCTRCHLKPHIVSFDFEEMRKKIDHSGD